jgi:protein-arginine kinase activator protein McsA
MDRFGCTACNETFTTDILDVGRGQEEHDDAAFYDRIAKIRQKVDVLKEIAAASSEGGRS